MVFHKFYRASKKAFQFTFYLFSLKNHIKTGKNNAIKYRYIYQIPARFLCWMFLIKILKIFTIPCLKQLTGGNILK